MILIGRLVNFRTAKGVMMMPLVFITGGVRSGKSAFAENYVLKLGHATATNRYVYLATGVATDKEMVHRIRRHQEDRIASEEKWHTVEAPYDIAGALQNLYIEDVVLWDCATTWLTNCLYEGYDTGNPCVAIPGCVAAKIERMKESLQNALSKGIAIVIVSNELQDELPYESVEIELYRKLLGELHQWFVKYSDEAYELDYGLAKKWK